MSSILDALKKVEQNSSSQDKGSAQAAAATNAAEQQEVHLPARQNNRTNRPLWLLMFVAVSIGGIVVYGHLIKKEATLPSSPIVQDVDKTVQPVSTIAAGRDDERIIAEKKSTGTIRQVARKTIEPSGVPSTDIQVPVREEAARTAVSIPVEQPAEKEVFPVEQEKDVPVRDIVQTAGTIDEKQADMPARHASIEPVPDLNNAPQTVVREELPILEAGILKLQAITWSPVAEKRFIVVNNTISRTRDVVNGYIISRINLDSIVVRQKNSEQEWLVEFRTR